MLEKLFREVQDDQFLAYHNLNWNWDQTVLNMKKEMLLILHISKVSLEVWDIWLTHDKIFFSCIGLMSRFMESPTTIYSFESDTSKVLLIIGYFILHLTNSSLNSILIVAALEILMIKRAPVDMFSLFEILHLLRVLKSEHYLLVRQNMLLQLHACVMQFG